MSEHGSDVEQLEVALERVHQRLEEALRKAETEAAVHPDRERSLYCDGTAHGLRAALRMLEEDVGLDGGG